jgi:hypothetical protein
MSDATPPPGTPPTTPMSAASSAYTEIDVVPSSGWTEVEKAAFAALRAEERSAAYLNSIRKMLTFFVVLTVLGLIGAVAVGLMEWSAIDSLKSAPTNPFG